MRVETGAMSWRRIHLCTGILERDERILLVANRYPNHVRELWNLPGGRQESPETVEAAVMREFREETGLVVRITGLAYVAESFDHATATQFTNFAFHVAGAGEPVAPAADTCRRLRMAGPGPAGAASDRRGRARTVADVSRRPQPAVFRLRRCRHRRRVADRDGGGMWPSGAPDLGAGV